MTTEYLSDEKIISLFWQRCETAITETDRKYGNYLLSIAYHILKNEADSEECQNDTYLGAWNSIPPQKPDMFAAYLAKITRRLAINRLTSDARQKRIPLSKIEPLSDLESFLPDSSNVEGEMEAKRIAGIISSYLRGIKKRRRYIFLCRYFALYPIAEIAARLGVSSSTVKKDLAKIRKELGEILKNEEVIL